MSCRIITIKKYQYSVQTINKGTMSYYFCLNNVVCVWYLKNVKRGNKIENNLKSVVSSKVFKKVFVYINLY